MSLYYEYFYFGLYNNLLKKSIVNEAPIFHKAGNTTIWLDVTWLNSHSLSWKNPPPEGPIYTHRLQNVPYYWAWEWPNPICNLLTRAWASLVVLCRTHQMQSPISNRKPLIFQVSKPDIKAQYFSPDQDTPIAH